MQASESVALPSPSGERLLVVLGTGGTIAGLAAGGGEPAGYRAAQLGVDRLLPGIPLPAGCGVVHEQLAQVDSKDMDFAVWRRLALRAAHWLVQDAVAGLVVTHGTDTLEETAFFLHALLAPRKPVVFTCAMRPADALSADGPANLRDALAVAACEGAQGVSAVCAGTVHAAAEVRKLHPQRLDAFGSGDAGPLGYVEPAGRLRLLRAWPAADPAGIAPHALPAQDGDWPWVEIVDSHAGADGAVVHALVRAGVRGLVVCAPGNGSVHQRLERALRQAAAGGVRVLRATRCALGPITGYAADALPHAGFLTPAKARIALLLELLAVGRRA